MLSSGRGKLERPNFEQSDFSIAVGWAEPAAHTRTIRETGIEEWYPVYAPTADAQIARLRIDSAAAKGLKRGCHTQLPHFPRQPLRRYFVHLSARAVVPLTVIGLNYGRNALLNRIRRVLRLPLL